MGKTKRELLDELMAAESMSPTKRVALPSDVVPILVKKGYHKKNQEHFVVISLDGGHNVIRTRLVFKGTANRCLIHPREIYRGAIRDNAVAVIAAHNHPSGNLEPSVEDREIHRKLWEAGRVLSINLLDSIIVNRHGEYYSMLEKGEA